MWWLIHSTSFIMPRISSRRKGKGLGRRTSTTENAISNWECHYRHCALTIHACGRASKRSHRDQTIWSDVPPAKWTTHCTRSATELIQPSALMEANTLRIVDTEKKGLSDFIAGTQVSNTLQQMRRRILIEMICYRVQITISSSLNPLYNLSNGCHSGLPIWETQ